MLKRLMLVLSLVASLSLVSPVSDAEASSGIESSWSFSSRSVGGWSFSWSSIISWLKSTFGSPSSGSTTPSNGAAVPELDPSAAGSAMVLLIGGVAYLTARRREEDEQA